MTDHDILGFAKAEIAKGASFQRLKSPLLALDGYHIFQFSREETQFGTVSGLGTDSDEQTAYLKAIMEYIERQIMLEHGPAFGFESSNGIAAHRTMAQAYKSALYEVYERDAFLLHWYTRTPFQTFKPDLTHRRDLLSKLEAIGVEVLFSVTFRGYRETTVCWLVRRSTRGFVVGLSCGRGTQGDSDKALDEAFVNLFFGFEHKTEVELAAKVRSNGIQSLPDHRHYWLLVEHLPDWVTDRTHARPPKRLGHYGVPTQLTLSNWPPVVGVKVTGALDMCLGPPGDAERVLLKAHGYEAGRGDILPHPIP